jgi:hypothetical protein
MLKVTKKCEQCGEEFKRLTNNSRDWENQKYCGRNCLYKKLKKRVIRICRYCGNNFECIPSRKEGENGVFCNKECAYKSRTFDERAIWQRESKKIFGYNCQKCGFKGKRIACHHIDGNKHNNPENGANWLRLCIKCHSWAHKMARTITRYLTREEILGTIPIGQKFIKKREDIKQLTLF